MKKTKISLLIFAFSILCLKQAYAKTDTTSDLLKAYCGASVLTQVFKNLNLNSSQANSAIISLKAQADQNRGLNSLYEIKLAAEKAGLYTYALKTDFTTLCSLVKKGQVIANITGNRHFCLIDRITQKGIKVYIPGINFTHPTIPVSEFLETWGSSAVLLLTDKNLNLKKYAGNYKFVSEIELKNILGGQGCANASGPGFGVGSSGRGSQGNGSGKSGSDSSNAAADSVTTEPVVIQNGNLFLNYNDIVVPTRGLPLKLKRYYNSEVVSEVQGWLPEPGAGSWAIENGEYSGQGDRSTSDLKLQDLTLELDMQTIQPGAHYSWETAWVNIRYTEDPNDVRKAYNCYYFLMHTDGKIELAKWQNGAQSFLVSKATAYRPTNKNHIKITASGGNIQVYINGALEINYTDTNPVASGRVALQSYFCHAHFDNVKISSGAQTYNYDFNTDDNEFIFGYGWTHSYSLRLKEYLDHVTLFRENNAKEIYVPNADGTYSSVPVNYYSKLTKDSGGFSLKDKIGTVYRFDLSGRLQYIEDRNLNRTTLSYSNVNGKTLLTVITEPTGRKITLEYGVNNMVSKAIDPLGNYLQYSYDTANHLVKVIDRNGNATNYAYDTVTHNLTSLTDPEGNIYRYNYAYNDRVNDQTDPLGQKTTFDYLWSTVHVINNRGEIYKYNFDYYRFLQSITDPQNIMERSVNDANGNVIDYYDKNSKHTAFTYDVNGNRTGIYDANNKWTTYTYDTTFNLPKTFTDARSNVTAFNYDTKGNLLQSVNAEGKATIYNYNSFGQPNSIIDPKGNLTKFTYDDYGNLSAKTDSLNKTTYYNFDILGRLTKITNALGNSTQYTYDNNGNILSLKDALNKITSYAYNKNDKLTLVADPLGNTTKYTYDCFGNLLSVTDASNNTTNYTYDTINQMHLNKANLLSITDAKGNKTNYNYDSLDRLNKVIDAQNNSLQFGYDPQGNLISRQDANGKTTTYSYNALNRLTGIQDPEGNYFIYTYDEVGNLTWETDNMVGYVDSINYTYDKINRMKSQVYRDLTRLDYTYDSNGNRNTLDISGLGRISYDYDNLNRLIKITTPDSKITQFSYDELSRRTQLNYPNGALSTYVYDNASRLKQLINKDKSSLDISKFIYTYDDAGRRTKVDLINGAVSYDYDKLNQLIQESGTVGGKVFTANYSYDPVGNRKTALEDGLSTSYSYNNLNQLTKTQAAGSKLIQVKGNVQDVNPVSVVVNGMNAQVANNQFVVDNLPLASGLNTIKAIATDSAGNSNSHQISVTYNSSASSTTYTYDKNGNLTQRQAGSSTENFSYDGENRLKTYTSPSQSASYIYNGRGQRLARTVNGITTRYYYDGDEIILEKTGSNSIYYLHGPRVDELIVDSRGYCYQADGLGSVVNLTDNSGAKTASYDYKAFGSIRNQSGSVPNPWLFTGRQFDFESGLYYNRNRYYNPAVGRFITQDPSLIINPQSRIIPYLLLSQLPNPLELQSYLYCINNPTNLTDPFGLEPGLQEQWLTELGVPLVIFTLVEVGPVVIPWVLENAVPWLVPINMILSPITNVKMPPGSGTAIKQFVERSGPVIQMIIEDSRTKGWPY